MKKKIQILFTLTASFFLTAHQRQCQHNQHNTATFNGPRILAEQPPEKSTPQTGTASVLKLAILAGKFFNTNNHKLHASAVARIAL